MPSRAQDVKPQRATPTTARSPRPTRHRTLLSIFRPARRSPIAAAVVRTPAVEYGRPFTIAAADENDNAVVNSDELRRGSASRKYHDERRDGGRRGFGPSHWSKTRGMRGVTASEREHDGMREIIVIYCRSAGPGYLEFGCARKTRVLDGFQTRMGPSHTRLTRAVHILVHGSVSFASTSAPYGLSRGRKRAVRVSVTEARRAPLLFVFSRCRVTMVISIRVFFL